MHPTSRPQPSTNISRPAPRRSSGLLGLGLSGAFLLAAACGGEDGTNGDTGPPVGTEQEPPAPAEPDAADEPTDGDGDEPPAAPTGGLLTAADLPGGFDVVSDEPLFDDQPLCEGEAAPLPEIVALSGNGFATEDFSVLVSADGIITAGQSGAYAAWVLGELERCDGVDGAIYGVDQIADGTWAISVSVDFGDGPELFSTSWMTLASGDAVAAVHVLDGGLSDIDGSALLATVASRVG